jgi:hypothetical protein
MLDAGSCLLSLNSATCTNCAATGSTAGTFKAPSSTTFTQATPPVDVSLCYGTGTTCNSGSLATETINVAGNAVPNVNFVLNTSLTAPSKNSGIWGLCLDYASYTKLKARPSTNTIPLIVKAAGLVDNVYAFHLNPAKNGGFLSIGGWDKVAYPTPFWLPSIGTLFYWQVGGVANVNGVAQPAGQNGLIVVDSGAAGQNLLTYLNQNQAFLDSLTGVPGACAHNTDTYIVCNCASLADMKNVVYNFTNGSKITIPPVNYATYKTGKCTTQFHYKAADAKLGGPTFKSYFVAFDYDKKQVGFSPY